MHCRCGWGCAITIPVTGTSSSGSLALEAEAAPPVVDVLPAAFETTARLAPPAAPPLSCLSTQMSSAGAGGALTFVFGAGGNDMGGCWAVAVGGCVRCIFLRRIISLTTRDESSSSSSSAASRSSSSSSSWRDSDALSPSLTPVKTTFLPPLRDLNK